MYPLYGILFRSLLVVLLFHVFSWADSQVIVSDVSADDVRDHLKELDRLKSSKLDESAKRQLTELWSDASEIAELNDRCGEISLTEELDTECSRFFRVKLPEFERRYTQLTGEVRLNALKLSLSMNGKREAIQACYDALPFGEFNLSKIYDVKVDVVPEPLDDDRTEIAYKIELGVNRERWNAFRDYVNSWSETCRSQILRSDGSGDLAPLFEKLLNSSKGFGVYALNRDTEGYNGYNSPRYKLVLKKNVSVVYHLNGKQIYSNTFLWGDAALYYNFRTGEMGYNSKVADSRSGRFVLSAEEADKGVYGNLKWSSSGGRGGQDFDDNTSDGIENSNKNNSPFRFDARTAVLMGTRGSVQDGLRDAYPDIWTGEYDEMVDDSLMSVSWLLAGVVRIQGSSFFAGLGGGFAVNWLTTSYPTSVSYGTVNQTESVNIWTMARPVFIAELGLFFGPVNEGEIGFRATAILDGTWTVTYVSGFVGYYVFNLEIGMAECYNCFQQLYVGFCLRIPFSLFW